MAYKITYDEIETLEFVDLTEIQKWIDAESEHWSILKDLSSGPSEMIRVAIDEFPVQFDQTLLGLLSIRSAMPDGEDQRENNIISVLQEKINSQEYVLSQSKLGQFATEECKHDRMFARKILWLAANQDLQKMPDDMEMHYALIALSDFRRGMSKDTLTANVREAEHLKAQYKGFIEKEAKLSKNRTRKLFTDLDQRKNDFENEISQIKVFYAQQISLQEPIQYWTHKATDHEKSKNRWGRLFSIYVFTALVVLASFILSFENGIQGFIASWQGTGIGAVASFAALIGIGMVIARVLYRLFASQLHLWNDARERVTMIQTYLALAAEGHAKEEFLGALMQRLFSPTSDGIVKSDLGVINPMDAIAKLLNK
ncbi:MAG: DUF6161 domain-containing protein [Devosiaceae bacterium]|nr:DUF6161 domain-containing protein [Devosiaceae bacterium]